MAEPITQEEWLAELGRIGADVAGGGDAVTVTEICDRTGKSRNWVRLRIRLALASGVVTRARKRTVSISGNPCTVPAYRLVPKKKGK